MQYFPNVPTNVSYKNVNILLKLEGATLKVVSFFFDFVQKLTILHKLEGGGGLEKAAPVHLNST